MASSYRYLSDEWLSEARRRVEASKEFRAAAKGLTATLLNVITDAPDGKTIFLYYGFKDGAIEESRVGSDPKLAARTFEFKATGTYETFSLINQGKLSSVAAVFQGKIKIEGNIAKAMRYVKPLEVYNGIVRAVPTEY